MSFNLCKLFCQFGDLYSLEHLVSPKLEEQFSGFLGLSKIRFLFQDHMQAWKILDLGSQVPRHFSLTRHFYFTRHFFPILNIQKDQKTLLSSLLQYKSILLCTFYQKRMPGKSACQKRHTNKLIVKKCLLEKCSAKKCLENRRSRERKKFHFYEISLKLLSHFIPIL